MPSNNTNAKLVDSKTIAAIFGVDPRRVQQLAKEGIITATKEGHANRYDLLPTIQKYIKYLSDKATGRDAPRPRAAGWKLRQTSRETRPTWPPFSSKSSRAPCTGAKMSRL